MTRPLNARRFDFVATLLLLLVAAPIWAGTPEGVGGSAGTPLLVGAGRASIDPPADMYPVPTRFGSAEGRYDACHVRAIAIKSGDTRLLLLVYELSDHPTVPGLLEQVAASTGFPRENILLTVTHNHTSPGDEPNAWTRDTPEMTQKRERYKEIELAAGVAAAKQAAGTMRPARVGFGTTDSYVNVNRNLKTLAGYWVEGPNHAGYSDKALSVLKFVDAGGKLIAALLNHGTHAVSAFRERDFDHRTKTSGNFPGIACRFVETRYGGDAVVAWTAGAAGDQDPILSHGFRYEYPDGYTTTVPFPDGVGFMLMESLGRTHGADAVRCIDSIAQYTETLSARHVETTVLLPAQKRAVGPDGRPVNVRMGWNGLRDESKYPYGRIPPVPNLDNVVVPDPEHPVEMQMHLVTLGEIALIFTNGEMYARLGSAVKAASPLPHTVVIAYSTAPSTDYIPDGTSVDQKTFQAFGPVIPGRSDDLILGAERKLFGSLPQ